MVVAMYHSQGMRRLKHQAQARLNITVVLPLIRSSVDHATIFGVADVADEATRARRCTKPPI
jgi:4-hydroxy-L-threonine phosphate dehydrogenase PdxA